MRGFLILAIVLAVSACAGGGNKGSLATPAECEGIYFDEIGGKKYLISEGGGVVPGYCEQYARPFVESVTKHPLPAGYVNCRTTEGKIVGMKPATCTREGGIAVD